jgi:beta-phosphoglucomutase-like phosphatase (HAD superfamily)
MILSRVKNILFDLDGVISNTAVLHKKCWKLAFDEYFKSCGIDYVFKPDDYELFFDGKSRDAAICDYLGCLDINLIDSNLQNIVSEISKLKNDIFNRHLKKIQAKEICFEDALRIISKVKLNQCRASVVSSSKNAITILSKLNISEFFDTIVDGHVIEKFKLKSKPHADPFNYCININGYDPRCTMVIEDSEIGIKSALNSNAKYIIGLNRNNRLLEKSNFTNPLAKNFEIVSSLDELHFV